MRKLIKISLTFILILVVAITSYTVKTTKNTNIFYNNIEALAAGEGNEVNEECMFSGNIECYGAKVLYTNAAR